MLARCLMQPVRTASLFRPSKSVLLARDQLRGQLIRDRKLTTNNQVRFNEEKGNKNSKLHNYERLRERLRTKTTKEIESLQQFEEELSQLGMVQKFKKIVSEYWHVILCVHAATSACWFLLAYGIKVYFELTPEPLIKRLELYNLPNFVIEPLRNKYLQFIAVPFFLYKCVTPLRYYSTIYGSMVAIRFFMPKGMVQAKKTPRIVQILFGQYRKNQKKD